MKSLFLILSGIFLLGTATVGAEENALMPTKTVDMKIEGMTCGMCEAKVKKQLSDHCDPLLVDRKSALCTLKEGTKEEQVVEECNKTGFKCQKG